MSLVLSDSRKKFLVWNFRVSDGCWEWQRATNPEGYGLFWNGHRMAGTHRAMYELFVSPISDGLQIDHLCRNTTCGRPDHLEPVTPRENTMRGDTPAAINAAKTRCIRGHPFDSENTYYHPSGSRRCRECSRLNDRKRYVEKARTL